MADSPKNEKLGDVPVDFDAEPATTSGFSAWWGGAYVKIGPRIGPVIRGGVADSDSDESSAAILEKQIAQEDGCAIQYRTCSWQKTAALLFSEYICLAMMSFPWSYSVLGLVPGLILTVVVAGFVLYTSLVLWEFCLRHPEVRDVCDIGQMLFWNKRWAWYATAVMFILNNTVRILPTLHFPCQAPRRSRRLLTCCFLLLQFIQVCRLAPRQEAGPLPPPNIAHLANNVHHSQGPARSGWRQVPQHHDGRRRQH